MITFASAQKARLKRSAYRNDLLRTFIRQMIKTSKTNQVDCAKVLGMTQPGFSKALTNMTFSPLQLILLMDYLDVDPSELSAFLAIRKDFYR